MLAVEYLNRSSRSVCYVAPTRSLCREVRRAMASRVRVLQKEAGPDLPDFPVLRPVGHRGPRPAGRRRGDDPRAASPPAPPRRPGRAGPVRHVHLRRGPAPEGDRPRVHPGSHDRAAGLPQPRDRSPDRADLRRDGQRRRDRAMAQPRRAGPAARVPVARPAAAARRLHHRGPLGRHAGRADPERAGLALPAHHPAHRPDPAADGRRPDQAADRHRHRLAAGPQIQEPRAETIRAGDGRRTGPPGST